MLLQNYEIDANDLVHLYFSKNRYIRICLDEFSGKILTRNKVNGTIQHTGILLGRHYQTGQRFVIHNHPLPGFAHITTVEDYAQGQQIRVKKVNCLNPQMDVIKIGLNAVLTRKKYRLLADNCQTLVNSACNNRNYSEDVIKWGGIALTCFLFARKFRKAS